VMGGEGEGNEQRAKRADGNGEHSRADGSRDNVDNDRYRSDEDKNSEKHINRTIKLDWSNKSMRMVAELGRPLRDPEETQCFGRAHFLIIFLLCLVFKISSLLDNGSSELEREGFSYNQEL